MGEAQRQTAVIDPAKLDLGQVVISYDRESDTLMLFLDGRGEPGVTVPVDDHLLLRMDRDRMRVIAVQLEGFLASVVRDRPTLLDALDLAELRGITPAEVVRLHRELAADRTRRASVVSDVIGQLSALGSVAD